MNRFAGLFTAIEQTTKTNSKLEALVQYFQEAPEEDSIWAIAILMGKTFRSGIKTRDLKVWATELAGIPAWLFEESYHVVGDLAEAIALVLPRQAGQFSASLSGTIGILQMLTTQPEEERKEVIVDCWMRMEQTERLVFNKLITGNFRMGISSQLVIRALARYTGADEAQVAHRLMGKWDPRNTSMKSLLLDKGRLAEDFRPYPFFLAYPLDAAPETLGDPAEWQVEEKYDGIRGQIIVRNGTVFVWSRGEELVTDKFPEFATLPGILPDGTVLDGEIIGRKDGNLLPFSMLQTRIGRKKLSPAILNASPLVMICYDLLEWNGADIRSQALIERRLLLMQLLATLPGGTPLLLSPVFDCGDWAEVRAIRARSREHHCEGVMLKRKDSIYERGRKRGNWWKWKVDPFTIDAVLIYAQPGHGRRANLFTDYTFAVWEGEQLVPFAKAYSGLSDKEIEELDRWIKRNTVEKFGPVRSVRPELVFELAFEDINLSARHKSGVAVRFPRILRWRKDKPAAEANHKQDLLHLIKEKNI